MSSRQLTSLSYTLFVLIGRDGASPHDIVRMVRQGRVYQSAAESQYYAEPKRLQELGYLSSVKEPGKTRERTRYMLTPKARAALRDWVRAPTPFPRFENHAVVRLLAADLVGEKPVRNSITAMRVDIADLLARIDVAEAVAETLPHRKKYLLLNHRLARRLLQAHLDWIEEVERELDGEH